MFSELALLYAFCLVLVSSVNTCSSVEDGNIFWLHRCTIKGNFTKSFAFQIKRGQSFQTVTSCSRQGVCQTFNSNFSSSFEEIQGLLHTQTGKFVPAFRIRLERLYLNRDENHFRCLVDGSWTFADCEFDIYVKPKKPTCDSPKLTPSGHELSVTCRTDQVYPGAGCIFQSEALPDNYSVLVTYNQSQSPIRAEDIATECEGRIPLTDLSVGNYQFIVTMYADVKEGMDKTSIESDVTTRFELSLPRVAVASDCPVGQRVKDGFIEKGTTATCKCELSFEGSPPGHAQWYTSEGTSVGLRNEDGSATLQLVYDALSPLPRYECRAESVVNEKQESAFFSPIFVDFSDAEESSNNENDKSTNASLNTALAALVAILGTALVVVIVVSVFLYQRKKPSAAKSTYSGPNTSYNDNHYYASTVEQSNLSEQQLPSSQEYDQAVEDVASGIYTVPVNGYDYIEPIDDGIEPTETVYNTSVDV